MAYLFPVFVLFAALILVTPTQPGIVDWTSCTDFAYQELSFFIDCNGHAECDEGDFVSDIYNYAASWAACEYPADAEGQVRIFRCGSEYCASFPTYAATSGARTLTNPPSPPRAG